MKGAELPSNTIVILLICLLIILLIFSLLFGVWNPSKNSVTQEIAKDKACQMLVSLGCFPSASTISIRDFDANKNGKLNDVGSPPIIEDTSRNWIYNDNCISTLNGDNLASLCVCYYSLYNDVDCKKNLCRCE